MKRNSSLLFVSSLTINLLLVGYIGCMNRVSVKERVTYSVSKENAASKKQLLAMNNVFVPAYTDTCNSLSGEEYKILIIGNSLAYHGVAKNIGWNYNAGMASSSAKKDYVHLLFDKIENKLPSQKICFRISNFASFERELTSFEQKSINSINSFQPDLIVFQLGENVKIQNQNDEALFKEKYIELINCFKKSGNPLTICTTPFFASLYKNKIIEEVALLTNSYLVDLSHLPLLETENYAKNEENYPGDKSCWKVSGIGIHPGDIGMENISKQIFITINAAISGNSK